MLPFLRGPAASPEAFQASLSATLSGLDDIASVRARPDFALDVWHAGEADPKTIHLGNAWAAYAGSGMLRRRRVLRQIVAAFAERPFALDAEGFDPARLLPLVRHRDYLMPDGPGAQWSVPLAGDLVTLLGYDGPRNVLMPARADLEAAGWPPETALARALDNFAATAPDLAIEVRPVGRAYFAEDGWGWLLPTVLMRPRTLDALARAAEADAVLVALPAREPIYFAAADRPDATEALAAAIRAEAATDHPQTRQILRHAPGQALHAVAEMDATGIARPL